MKLHEQLKALYASRWEGLCNALQTVACNGREDVKPAYPFLLSLVRWKDDRPTESWYADADLKVMVFGQETNSWTGKNGRREERYDDAGNFGSGGCFSGGAFRPVSGDGDPAGTERTV